MLALKKNITVDDIVRIILMYVDLVVITLLNLFTGSNHLPEDSVGFFSPDKKQKKSCKSIIVTQNLPQKD